MGRLFFQSKKCAYFTDARLGIIKKEFGWEPKYFIDNKAGAQILFKKLPVNLTIAYIPKGPIGVVDKVFWEKLILFCKKNRGRIYPR